MTHTIHCPECGEALQVPDELIGTAVQCPKCQHAFAAVAPAKPAPAPEPVLPAGHAKPSNVTAMGVLALVGGIVAIILSIGMGAGSGFVCCLWPGTYYSLGVGILALVRGSALLGPNACLEPPPKTLAILMIINIINGDVANLVIGIIMLTFCNQPEVIAYLKKPTPA